MTKHCILKGFFLIESYVQCALRKELFIVPLVALIELLWKSLTERFYQYLEQVS